MSFRRSPFSIRCATLRSAHVNPHRSNSRSICVYIPTRTAAASWLRCNASRVRRSTSCESSSSARPRLASRRRAASFCQHRAMKSATIPPASASSHCSRCLGRFSRSVKWGHAGDGLRLGDACPLLCHELREIRSVEIGAPQVVRLQGCQPLGTLHHLLNGRLEPDLVAIADRGGCKRAKPVTDRSAEDAELLECGNAHAFDRLP